MKNEYRTKEQLLNELEISETQRKRAEEALRKNEETERRFQKRLTDLLEVSNELSRANAFDDLCQSAVELGQSRLEFDRLGIWFVDDDPGIIVGSFGVNESGQLRDERSRRITVGPNSLMGQIISDKTRLAIQVDAPLFNDRGEVIGHGSQAIAAVWDGKKLIGCVSMDNLLLRQTITEYQCDLLTLYASALGNLCSRKQVEEKLKQSFEKLRMTLGGTIRAMALTVERRDPYTAGHQRRVANLARTIATEMSFSKERIEGIRMAGSIHDIGKISIPSEILSKPGRLTEIEFALIKTHSQEGYDILKGIEFPWPVAQIVLQHHESINGSGYPLALSGEKIIPEARILSVADVVEAMASHRPYRPALGIDKALEEISQNRDILYDPEAVDACLRVFAGENFKFE